MPNNGYVGVFAARWKIFALRDGQGVDNRREDALVNPEQHSRCPFPPSSVRHRCLSALIC